jgi:hypothetical protein
MSFGERLLSGLRTIVLIEERTKALDGRLDKVEAKVGIGLADHESRLVRLETIVAIARPDGSVLRIGRDGPAVLSGKDDSGSQ